MFLVFEEVAVYSAGLRLRCQDRLELEKQYTRPVVPNKCRIMVCPFDASTFKSDDAGFRFCLNFTMILLYDN